MLKKVLIANRGEIAVRVIRTCREMGVATVAVYSELDRDALHVRLADEAYALGGQTAAESYLNTAAILTPSSVSGADGVHPGYGFFSENTDFARAITQNGVTFIGPPPEAIEVMGDKISSRHAAERVGVSGVPGRSDVLTSPTQVVDFGNEFGWPVAIKAAFGGGGRGMKVVTAPEEAAEALESAMRESLAYFGRDECYVERYLAWPRHVEMQIIADTHGTTLWLGERDCSAQRRHQKLIEESPAPNFPDEVRRAMGEAAVKVAKACGYVNAGTVEFLYQDGEFFFLEMNTRLQVEHPVTELVTGLDLVEWQLRVASGEPLGFTQDEVQRNGHAIEVRINAEDPTGGALLPVARHDHPLRPPWRPRGPPRRRLRVGRHGQPVLRQPGGQAGRLGPRPGGGQAADAPGHRRDGIEGVATTLPADVAILSHPDFIAGEHSTNWVEHGLDLSGITDPDEHRRCPRERSGRPAPRVLRDVTAEVDGRRYQVKLWVPDVGETVVAAGLARTRFGRPNGPRPPRSGAGSGTVAVPMQGTIVKVLVAVGDVVEVGPDRLRARSHEDGEHRHRREGRHGERGEGPARGVGRSRRRRRGHRVAEPCR